jgi:chitinase
MEQFNKGLQYWTGRGLPKSKRVPGVPFYSRAKESPGETASYARLVASNPAAAQTDTFELSGLTHGYNGIPTIKEKTRIALESAGGIMFWVLDADAPGELSLVNAIYQTAHPK